MTKKALKIVRLETQNVMAIKAAEVDAGGRPVVCIGGENGQGKTSLISSIAMAIGGKRLQPEQPVRKGAARGEVKVDLGDMIIRRTFTPSGGTLTVTGKDGAKYPSPQALLDGLTGELTFDPLAFARAKPSEQVETLRRLTGVDVEGFDEEHSAVYEERTLVGREAKRLKARLSELEISKDAPEEPISIAALLDDLEARQASARENAVLRGRLDSGQRELVDIERRIEAAAHTLEDLRKLGAAHASEVAALAKTVDALEEPDIDSIKAELDQAEEKNRAWERNRQARRAMEEEEEARKRIGELSLRLEEIDQAKADAIAAAKLPVKGLSFGAEGVTFRGVPFSQCSSAEQLKVSVALGLALNPDIRILLIRDGSLLDEKSMGTIQKLAEARGAQIWIERVGSGEEVSVVISNGVVSEDRTKGEGREDA